MNGIHDLGGMHGFGAINRQPDEPVFHSAWERRAFGLALQVAEGVKFSDDDLRTNIERIPPATYLNSTYYELWTRSVEAIVTKRNVLTHDEIQARMQQIDSPVRAPGGSGITLDEMEESVAGGYSTRRDTPEITRAFSVGDSVRVRNEHPPFHTRVPRYCRGRTGVIQRDHGVFVFPDTNARREGECPQHCYTVEFAACELWGSRATPHDRVHVDLWQSYLELNR